MQGWSRSYYHNNTQLVIGITTILTYLLESIWFGEMLILDVLKRITFEEHIS
jgi:hypothetical protein